MTKVLIVTNDYPPRRGGIQSFVHALARRLPADGVVVYAPAWPGAAEFDAALPFPVIRHPGSLMLPVPSVGARACALLAEHSCDRVLCGASRPSGSSGSRTDTKRAGPRCLVRDRCCGGSATRLTC